MTDPTGLQVEVTETGPVTRSVVVEVPTERVQSARKSVLSSIRQKAKVPGFRPGKAPEAVVARNYRSDIEQAMLDQLVRESIDEALQKVEDRVLNVRDVMPEPFEDEAPFRYEAVLEVPPQVKVKGYKKLKVKRPVRDIDEAKIDEVLEDLRKRNVDYREATGDESLAEGDRVTLSYQATQDGEPVPDGEAEHYTAVVGQGGLHPEFEANILGAQTGDQRAFDVTFTEENAPSEALSGESVHFDVDIESVEKRELPALDDAFAASVLEGEDLEGLRKRIEQDLHEASEHEAERAIETQLIEALLEKHEFVVPPGMVERRRQQLAEQAAHRLLHQGYPEEAIRQMAPMLLAEVAERAQNEVQLGFLLEAIAAEEKLEVTDDEVETELRRIAEAQGESPEAYVSRARSEGFFEGARGELRNRKALAKVEEYANIKDVPAEVYAEEREKERAEREAKKAKGS